MQNDSYLSPGLKLFKDSSWTFLLPSICVFSLVTNTLNIVVFSNRTLLKKNSIYHYMLINSVVNFIYSLICLFVFVMRCGNFCQGFGRAYLPNFYEAYLYNYLTSVLGIFNIFIEIAISLQRLVIITNRNSFKCCSRGFVVTLLFAFSAIYYVPNLFWREIVPVEYVDEPGNSTRLGYALRHTRIFDNDMSLKLLIALMSGFRGLLILVLLFFINLLTVLKFQKRLEKKDKMKSVREQDLDLEQEAELIKQNRSNSCPTKLSSNNNHHIEFTNKDEITRCPAEQPGAAELRRQRPLGSVSSDKSFNNKAKRNMTRMVVAMSILFFIGNLPHTIALILIPFLKPTTLSVSLLTVFVVVSNSLLFGSHGVCIFIYYYFNKHFRNSLNAILNRYFGLKLEDYK